MRLVLALLAMLSLPALADGGGDAPPATKCDPSPGLDTDGMPLCPQSVLDDSAWQLWKCSYGQVKVWHPPTKAEDAASQSLVRAWASERASGQSAALATEMLLAAKAMSAEICRAKTVTDSYLVVNVAPGIKDYAGGNLLLREVKASRVIMVLPHSDSDGYYSAGPQGFKGSKSLAYIGNGHKRGNVVQKEDSDFVHHLPNLAYDTAEDIFQAYKGSYLFHLHGDGTTKPKGLMRPQDGSAYSKAFMAAVEAATKVTEWDALNAGFTTDNLPFHSQVKSELPASIYQNQDQSIARIVSDLEKSSFLWESFAPSEDLVPAVAPSPSPSPKPYVAPQDPHAGTPKLTCVSIKYSDGKQLTTEAKCLTNAQMVSEFYARNSRGKLVPVAKTGVVTAPYPSTASNEGNDMALIKAKFPSDYWILPRFCSTASHAGSKIAWICGQLIWDSSHEFGHLISLQHSGTYLTPDGSYNQYGDHESVMGSHQSNLLTAPQYYWEGWTPALEVETYQGGAPKQYTLKKVNDFSGKGLATVIIPHTVMGDERDGFLSFSNGVEFHLANPGGGSALVQRGITDYKDPSGLEVKLVTKTDTTATVSVSATK